MKLEVILFLSLFSANALAQSVPKKVGGHYSNGFVFSYSSDIDGKTLTFGLTDKGANDQSVWRTTEKNPPVSVRDAIASAGRKLQELFPAKRTWTLEEVKLNPVSYTIDAEDGIELWQYYITFARHRISDPAKRYSSDIDGQVGIVVLMDGTVINPIIGRRK